jgi:hypothetical protein
MVPRVLTVVELAVALVVVVAIAASELVSTQSKIDVSGVWTFDIQTSQATGTPTITFKQDGETLTGTYEGEYGPADISGTLKGQSLRFSYDLQAQGRSVDVVHVGTIDGNTMKGNISILGGQVSGTYTATRK